jgi:hypothetical protein
MGTTDDSTGNENKTTKVLNIPRSDSDLKEVSALVAKTWLANTQITLIWTTQAEFETVVTNFSGTLMQRNSAGAGRPEFTVKLKLLDKDIDRDIENIKRYLVEKYGKVSAPSYYAAFGIVKENKRYKLPTDHDNRKDALALLIPALTVHGFQNFAFGQTYWTDIKTRFDLNLAQSKSIDSSVSINVGSKNILKIQIKKVLNSLINVIKGNYPDDYKNVLRNWGFQKEKY